MNQPDSCFGFSVLNVGQGSLQVFDKPDGGAIVFDCNLKGAPEYVIGYLRRRKIKRVDLLIVTGTDEDHADVDGLKMLSNNYRIHRVWIPDFPKETDNWKKFRQALAELSKNGTVVEKPVAGDETTIGAVHLKALGPHPDDSDTSNNASIVVKLTVDNLGFLVPGDCEDKRWESILQYFKKWLPSHVLVAPHHGSDHGCVVEVIKEISPLYTVISVGEDNSYGHPDSGALEIYRRYTKKQVFITKDDGSVLFECNGQEITKVITDAGKDSEAIKEQAHRVARALAAGSPLLIRPSGLPSTSVGNGIAYRPTHSHGGEKAETSLEVD